jgi:hypothetical protein
MEQALKLILDAALSIEGVDSGGVYLLDEQRELLELAARTIPLAAKGFEVPNIGLGLKRAIGKSLVQLVVYPVIMAWMGIRGLKLARSLNT